MKLPIKDIAILLTIRAIRWFLVIMPIVTLFYRESGITMQEIFWIQSAFALSVVIFDIPTGYFADVIGRKTSIIIGLLITIFGFSIYIFSSGFWGFFLAEFILGIGSSFGSGADSAILYDLLIESKNTEKHKKIQGYLQMTASISESIASFIGGMLAVYSLRLPFYVELGVLILALPLAFLLREPQTRKHTNHDGAVRGIIKIIRYCANEHKEVRALLLFSGLFGASTLVMTWLLQSYFTLVQLPLVYFGIVWSVFNLSLVPISFFSHRIEEKIGKRNSLLLVSLLPIVGYLLLSYIDMIWGLLFVFCFYFARGLGSIILNDYINILVPSEIRATILSVQGLVMRGVFSIVGPLVGWIQDIYSLPIALLFAGILFGLLFLFPLSFLLRQKVS